MSKTKWKARAPGKQESAALGEAVGALLSQQPSEVIRYKSGKKKGKVRKLIFRNPAATRVVELELHEFNVFRIYAEVPAGWTHDHIQWAAERAAAQDGFELGNAEDSTLDVFSNEADPRDVQEPSRGSPVGHSPKTSRPRSARKTLPSTNGGWRLAAIRLASKWRQHSRNSPAK